MSLDQRAITILTKVLNGHHFVAPKEIMEELSISKRTLYYDVEKINDWLKNHRLSPLQYLRSAGYTIEEHGKQAIRNMLSQTATDYVYSPRERIAGIAIMILAREQSVTLQSLLEKLQVSRSTLLSDIKQLKTELSKHELLLKSKHGAGYYIDGSEKNKRKVLITYLAEVSALHNWAELAVSAQVPFLGGLYSNDSLNPDPFALIPVAEMVHDLEVSLQIQYTDDFVHSLNLHIYMLIKRFNRGKFVTLDPVEREIIQSSKEYSAAQSVAKKMEKQFNLRLPDDEICYLTTFFLSGKVSGYTFNEESNDLEKLKQIIAHMVDDFQKYAAVQFKNRNELERNLFVHLKPAYYRIKYNIPWSNPLAEKLQDTYHDLLILTRKVVHHFEFFLGKKVSEDEIAYIAIHFGGWLDKEGMKMGTRKKAVIVCSSGVGTSRLVQKQVEDLLSSIDIIKLMTVREYENNDLAGVDYIFTTVPVAKKSAIVFTVSPILKPAEKAMLLRQIESTAFAQDQIDVDSLMDIISKHAKIENETALYEELLAYMPEKPITLKGVNRKPMLNELLTIDKIQLKESVPNWEEALRLAAKPLLAGGNITESYVEAMIESVHTLGPYIVIAPGIALPHARPEAGVKSVGMSFLRLQQPCSFTEKPEHQVSLLFVLAAIDNDMHLKALSQLSTLLSEQQNIERLSQAETVAEIKEIFNQYSKPEEETK